VVGEQLYAESIVGAEGYEVYESTGTGGCTLAQGQSKVNAEVRALLERSPRELVAGRIDHVETSGGLYVRRLVADDGAEANLGVMLADGTACTLERDGRCVGIPSADAGRTCREPGTSAAPSGARLVRVGSQPLHLELFEMTGAGAEADAVFQLPAGEKGKFLTDQGTSCAVWDAADGSLRCAEVDDVAESGAFSDRSCTQPLYELYAMPVSQLAPAAVSLLRYVKRDFDQDKRYRIEAVSSLEVYQGAVFSFTSQSQRCPDASAIPGCGCAPVDTGEQLLALDQDLGIDSLPLVRSTRLE
jgi:hypothetical protein